MEKYPFELEDMIEIISPYRFQWEEAQNAYVLLFPEGIIQLNDTGGAILKECTGEKPVLQIIKELEEKYQETDLQDNVCLFLTISYKKGWIGVKD